ncbi:hypothetical protein HZA55_06620 [Candidatus Poribacteria bacterium]|nr:hypothetical protein [Candidatus Poribacteria bacterium]
MVKDNYTSILLSSVFHIVIFIILPYSKPTPAKRYNYSEVELSKISFEAAKEKMEPEIKVVDKKSPVDLTNKNNNKVAAVKDAAKLMIPVNKGYQLSSPRFGVNLPTRFGPSDEATVKIHNDKGAPTAVPFGEPEVAAHDLVEDTNLFNNREGIYKPGVEDGKDSPDVDEGTGHYTKFKEKYVPPAPPKPPKEIVKEEPYVVRKPISLGGTIGNREVLYKPKDPEIELDKDIEIEVKFFVLQDGQVREAIPIIKGDTRLESIAIQYMKSWIFAPLSRDVEQIEQWGKLKIKFKKISKSISH